MTGDPERLLRRVAHLYNVQTIYYDIFGNLRRAPREAVLAVLRALGAPVERMDDLPQAYRERRRALWEQGLEPVLLAWEGTPDSVRVRVPRNAARDEPRYRIDLEGGDRLEGTARDDPARAPVERNVEGVAYVARQLAIPAGLPLGYHRLAIRIGGVEHEAHLLAAPFRAFAPEQPEKAWGLFCPVYALRSEHNWGIGDLTDLAGLVDFTAGLGGSVAATLPLLPVFLDEPFNPSPYAPVSRFFWNELFLDITRIPELERCPIARAMLNSDAVQREIAALRDGALVDYRRAMALKRRVLAELARCAFEEPGRRFEQFQRFTASQPALEDYAAFRATVDRLRKPWMCWPAPSRDGTLRVGDYDQDAKRYHLYVQWQADEQMRDLAEQAGSRRAALYLDFPLGVNRDGYDVWRERPLFALAASGGAPPDDFFTKGQNWGFPPLRPDTLRAQGYGYWIRSLRHHLRHAGMLRIDHILGLHRSFWVPEGFAPTEGMYVRYPAEEFYAVLNLESHRHRARIVGENLGTVPAYVNRAMARHQISGMVVGQFAVGVDPGGIVEPADANVVVSLNTHDTPTFGGFWGAHDVEDRLALGLIDVEEAARERARRSRQRDALIAYLRARGWSGNAGSGPEAALSGWLQRLARSPAFLLLVNLEDLWLEDQPQNVPGTWNERPNWRRKARLSLEQLREFETALELLKLVNATRRSAEILDAQ